MTASQQVRARLVAAQAPFHANDNIAEHLRPGDLDALSLEVQACVQALLDALVIDTGSDHNTKDTAARVARMYLREVFSGRYQPQPKVTDFPNARGLDEVYTVGPITVRSACSHHLVPITGECWIGVLPGDRVIGLSKFNRLVEWVMARPQIQEEAAMMLADTIERLIQPRGLAIVIRAQHQCMTWRGVRDNETRMTTSIVRGIFRENHAARAEFFSMIER
jgi:GTP cyclohydrolase I